MEWFRLYNEIIDDPKINKMSPGIFKFFIFLLALASESHRRGVIILPEDDITWRLRMSKSEFYRGIEKLISLGIITKENEEIHIVKWGERQKLSDSSAERVRRHRERYSNVTETPSESESDQESDTEESLRVIHDTKWENLNLTDDDEIPLSLLTACAKKISEAYKKKISPEDVQQQVSDVPPVVATIGIINFIEGANKPSFRVLKIFIGNVTPGDVQTFQAKQLVEDRPKTIIPSGVRSQIESAGAPETIFKAADKKWGNDLWEIIIPPEQLLSEYGWSL